MQGLMRYVAIRLFKVFAVKRLYNGVFVALSEHVLLILFVQHLGARLGNVDEVARFGIDRRR